MIDILYCLDLQASRWCCSSVGCFLGWESGKCKSARIGSCSGIAGESRLVRALFRQNNNHLDHAMIMIMLIHP